VSHGGYLDVEGERDIHENVICWVMSRSLRDASGALGGDVQARAITDRFPPTAVPVYKPPSNRMLLMASATVYMYGTAHVK